METRGYRRIARDLLLDAVVPVAVCVALTALVFRRVLPRLGEVVIGPIGDATPSDLNGTLWFYAWLERSLLRGENLLHSTWIAYPAGEALGGSFPNRIDAWVALPFLHFLPFPEGFDVFVTAIPVLGALAAYAFFRSLTPRVWLALSAAVVFGFQHYTFYEIGEGRPVTALIASLPLFLMTWWRALVTPGRAGTAWAMASGLAAGLVTWSYAPWTLWAGTLAVGMALGCTLIPAERVSRGRPAGAALVALPIAALVVGPYLHELLLARTGRFGAAGETLPFWDPGVWRGLWRVATAPSSPVATVVTDVFTADKAATFDSLWKDPQGRGSHLFRLPGGFVFVLLGAAALGGRGALGWALAGLGLWFASTAPVPGRVNGPQEWWVTAMHMVPSPTAALIHRFPSLSEHLRPYRGGPVASLAFLSALVAGWEGLARRMRDRGQLGRAARFAAGVPLVALAVTSGLDAARVEVPRITINAWHPSPFFAQLAAEPGDAAVIDLPMGFGHGLALPQLVHRRPRAEREADTLYAPLTDTSMVPQVWLRPLRPFGTPGSADPPDDLLDSARRSGFGWILLHTRAYRELERRGIRIDRSRVDAWLRARLGAPAYTDAAVTAYRL